MIAGKDYYAILGIHQNATQDEIKAAYRELIKKYHPDRVRDPVAKVRAKEMSSLLNEAHSVLTDPVEREKYDNYPYQQHVPARTRRPESGSPVRTKIIAGVIIFVAIATLIVVVSTYIGNTGSQPPTQQLQNEQPMNWLSTIRELNKSLPPYVNEDGQRIKQEQLLMWELNHPHYSPWQWLQKWQSLNPQLLRIS